MKPTTLGALKPVWASITGGDPDKERAAFVRDICGARQRLWSFPSAREAFFEDGGAVVTIRLSRFSGDYSHCSHWWPETGGSMVGISLPHYAKAAAILRHRGERIPVLARYAQDVERSQLVHNVRLMRAVEIGDGYPLPVDYQPGLPLEFRAHSAKDAGKPVAVRHDGVNESVRLAQTPSKTAGAVVLLDRHGLTFPTELDGPVDVSQANRKLTTITPGITVSDYRRYIISGASAGMTIEWEGLSVPAPIWWDTDPVECGNEEIWRDLIQFRSLHSKTGRTPSEERAYQTVATALTQFIDSELESKRPVNITPVLAPAPTTAFSRIQRISRIAKGGRR